MSNALQTKVLLDAIRVAVQTAWGAGFTVFYGDPQSSVAGEPLPLPYAVVAWNPPVIEFGGLVATVTKPSQRNEFLIIGRWPLPSDPTDEIDLAKVDQANALIAALQTGSNFAGIGIMPLVTQVERINATEPGDNSYYVSVTFEVYTQADHH